VSQLRTITLAVAGAAALGAAGLTAAQATTSAATTKRVSVRISGGHATDPRDGGRPVALVAAGLGVPTAVFRKAFSGVSPAGAGVELDPAQVQRNKAALLKALAPYGVTNEDLDRVSDHYRYDGSAGELWPTRAATATATVEDGRVTALRLLTGGAGYSSTPTVTVPGYKLGTVTVRLAYGKALASNGRVRSLRVAG
jgi:hypothetical protein